MNYMDVKVYTTANCAHCKHLKDYLTEKGVVFDVIDVSDDVEKRHEMITKTGQLSVPVLVVGDKYVIGFNRDKVNQLLDGRE